VIGKQFKSMERVTLVLHARETSTRTLRADADGSFVAKYAVLITPCVPFSLQAFGAKGSRARTLPARRICDPDPGE
jgi:hypothetical protein